MQPVQLSPHYANDAKVKSCRSSRAPLKFATHSWGTQQAASLYRNNLTIYSSLYPMPRVGWAGAQFGMCYSADAESLQTYYPAFASFLSLHLSPTFFHQENQGGI